MTQDEYVKLLREAMSKVNEALDAIRELKSGRSQGSYTVTTGTWADHLNLKPSTSTTTGLKTEDPLKTNTGQSITEYLESIGKYDYDNGYYCEVCDNKHWNYDPTWEDDAQILYDSLFKILVSKQNDYGPDNIRLAPGGALNGLRVRLYDKIARLSNLIDTGATPENESLRDTLIDIANYGVIGVMILDDTFPKSKE